MFPWEHAAVAYLCYAGYARWRTGAAPAGWAVLVVFIASQLPDLIDKPLAWQLSLLPSGRSLAHSIVVAVPLVCALGVGAHRRNAPQVGIAFALGYCSHLVTDTIGLYPGGTVQPRVVLWPVATYQSPTETPGGAAGGDVTGETIGVLARTSDSLLGAYPSLVALDPTAADLVRLGFVALAVLVWVADGRPGLDECWWVLRRPIAIGRS